jgi:hypothetical protein
MIKWFPRSMYSWLTFLQAPTGTTRVGTQYTRTRCHALHLSSTHWQVPLSFNLHPTLPALVGHSFTGNFPASLLCPELMMDTKERAPVPPPTKKKRKPNVEGVLKGPVSSQNPAYIQLCGKMAHNDTIPEADIRPADLCILPLHLRGYLLGLTPPCQPP